MQGWDYRFVCHPDERLADPNLATSAPLPGRLAVQCCGERLQGSRPHLHLCRGKAIQNKQRLVCWSL
ncbi:hypothetical protein E2C01_057734 [Portunus trituberculatus]|uniref:Uncharacterized protein n=1 Tax=Portunus trituberculatus TaxID=210409 RepID=A0A5B7H0T7_PORTR|nr:hypothetical protein [Portunus trituberculatus]